MTNQTAQLLRSGDTVKVSQAALEACWPQLPSGNLIVDRTEMVDGVQYVYVYQYDVAINCRFLFYVALTLSHYTR